MKLHMMLVACAVALAGFAEPERAGYIVVSDFVAADGQTDVADGIQKLIDEHPNRTLYFPDGTYLLGHPILTPAHPRQSVDLRLSNYAVLKAAPGWNASEAMVRLGGKCLANDITTPGSNYGFTGGIVDGSDVADGISIDGGRETAVTDVSIKHVRRGLHIKHGANSGSSDCDILHVNIVGNGAADSIGVLVEGYDNTLSNMRIAGVHIGVELRGGGNSMRNLHPLHTQDKGAYDESIGFWDKSGGNWYNFCYSDHFATGFRTTGWGENLYDSCFCMWYTVQGSCQRVFQSDGAFEAIVNDLRVGFHRNSKTNIVLTAGKPGGHGRFAKLWGNVGRATDKAHEAYLRP